MFYSLTEINKNSKNEELHLV